jgi:hypothetical protein
MAATVVGLPEFLRDGADDRADRAHVRPLDRPGRCRSRRASPRRRRPGGRARALADEHPSTWSAGRTATSRTSSCIPAARGAASGAAFIEHVRAGRGDQAATRSTAHPGGNRQGSAHSTIGSRRTPNSCTTRSICLRTLQAPLEKLLSLRGDRRVGVDQLSHRRATVSTIVPIAKGEGDSPAEPREPYAPREPFLAAQSAQQRDAPMTAVMIPVPKRYLRMRPRYPDRWASARRC